MSWRLVAETAHPSLAREIARTVEVALTERTIECFPDGEIHVELRTEVRGDDVYVVQPTGPPVGERLLERLLIADACRRAGAAPVPYRRERSP